MIPAFKPLPPAIFAASAASARAAAAALAAVPAAAFALAAVAPAAVLAAAVGPAPVAEAVFPALYPERPALNERGGQLAARGVVNLLDGRARDVHAPGALLLREPFPVYEAYRLILVHRQHDGLARKLALHRRKLAAQRHGANLAAFPGSGHDITS